MRCYITYRGRVKNGVIVLEEGVHLREGMTVRVETPGQNEDVPAGSKQVQSLQEGLLSFAGVIKDGPSDFARNHDHYLHGTPPTRKST